MYLQLAFLFFFNLRNENRDGNVLFDLGESWKEEYDESLYSVILYNSNERVKKINASNTKKYRTKKQYE